MVEPTAMDYRALIDGLGQAVLLFDSDGKLVMDNLAARALLGVNIPLIRAEGWPAITMLLDGPREDGSAPLDQLREQALRSTDPLRFHTYFAGAYMPCWITAIYGAGGSIFTMLTMEQPDWEALTELMSTFRNEARMSISATRGHAELVKQLLAGEDDPGVQTLARRVLGFTDVIATHMLRLQNLMGLLERLEVIRTGELKHRIRESKRHFHLMDFIEDYLEELADDAMADPDMGGVDFRERLTLSIPEDLHLTTSPLYLGHVLRDMLRNAACYSPPDSTIDLRIYPVPASLSVQFDVTDRGYGVREKETDRVFQPFKRARQPQIIGVDGYGLSLYLAKAEIEAMGGHIWFVSEEGVGSTFSFKLPLPPQT
ncbi:MAG: sensor histidine kinase [Anaerolineae bacterium]|nr:sensor histidine kinase [Anaerolineae bacterium]